MSALYGAGEVGKSRVLLQLSVAVIDEQDGPMLPTDPLATGEAARDVPEVREHGTVVMLTWEDEVDELKRRVRLLRNAGAIPEGVTTVTLGDRLRVVDMRAVGGPLWAPRPDGSRHVASEGDWTAAGRRLLALMDAQPPAARAG